MAASADLRSLRCGPGPTLGVVVPAAQGHRYQALSVSLKPGALCG